MAPDSSAPSAPHTEKLTADVPAAIAAAAQDTVIAEAPFGATVTGISLLPEAAVTGATATKRTFTVLNKKGDGLGTTLLGTLDLITGVDLVAYDEKAFTLTATAADLVVAAGDVIELHEVVASTGTAHAGGVIQVELSRS